MRLRNPEFRTEDCIALALERIGVIGGYGKDELGYIFTRIFIHVH